MFGSMLKVVDFIYIYWIPEDHHLCPLMTYSSPSLTIDAWMLVASDDATCNQHPTDEQDGNRKTCLYMIVKSKTYF